MKLLLAEDDPVSREVLAQAARKAGWEVTAVANGQEAWHELLHQDYPVVLSDWNMPVVNGEELCRRVRARGGPDYIYFIIVTVTVWNHEGYLKAMEAGVDDFLNKTAQPLEVMMRLKVAQRISGFARRLSQLEGIIPICSHCRRLRDEESTYQLMETFFQKKSHLAFSHGICPECMNRHYPLTETERSMKS
jgi:sigma-B regulation protein RsbU (phosphoserine phosphatase)